MAPPLGTRLGPYEITAPLGAGGMGEVFRAHDTKLNRDVAIKVLPDAVAADRERLERFEREAQVLAALNHPHIAHIHGFEDSTGTPALVMELVEGPTLADRIAHGPLPVDEALAIAKQIAEALDAAHEHGIIHRDLKPANVKVRDDGTVKVLDFGLAKVTGPVPPSSAATMNSPTLSVHGTVAGVILGTAAYMSPEQAKGRPVDKRADIWSFGCVLYEMLAGKRAFGGDDVTDFVVAVMSKEPDWQALPADTPPSIRRLLTRCLRKDPKARLRDAGDAVIELEETPPARAAAPSPAARLEWRRFAAVGVAGVLTGAIVGSAAVWRLKPDRSGPLARFTIALAAGHRLAGLTGSTLAVSPDGRRLVYVGTAGGQQQLYLRDIDNPDGKPIVGTEGAFSPFFAPDGASLAFFTHDALKKVSLGGGPCVSLARVNDSGRGGSWGPDGNIVFASGPSTGLSVIPSTGGMVRALTQLDARKGEGSHRFPHHVPDGSAVIFTVGTGGSWDDARIEVLPLGKGDRRVLIEGGSDGRYVPDGHLLVYLRAGTLMAAPVDAARWALMAPPIALVENVLASTENTGVAQAAFADAGSFFYVRGSARAFDRTLVWVDRTGNEQPIQAPPRAYRHPRISPDGRRVVVDIDEGNKSDEWIYDSQRGTLTRFTSDGDSFFPIWTSDGKRITFVSQRTENLFSRPVEGGPADRLTTSEHLQSAACWFSNGITLAYTDVDPSTGSDIWTLSTKTGKSEPFLRTPFNEQNAACSPDGRWLAYESDESGRNEVYVLPFPGPGSKILLSTDGGTEPVWSADGRELFYRNGDKMMAVPVAIAQRPFRPSVAVALFERPYHVMSQSWRGYDVAPGGRRFLMVKESSQVAAATHIDVVLNGAHALEELAAANRH